MKTKLISRARFVGGVLVFLTAIGTLRAEIWQGVAGAQTGDRGKQVFAFLPNEFWIHSGDVIQWTFGSTEGHTVSFLVQGQPRPPFPVGCPGITPTGSPFTGNGCVNSGPQTNGITYTVSFPVAGNFKLVCLVHSRMTGTIHVLDPSKTLPHDQAFYDRQAADQVSALLAEASRLESQNGSDGSDEQPRLATVNAGFTSISGTGGGSFTVAIMRFLNSNTIVHVGDTVEWTNPGPPVFHTVTFGTEPANLNPPTPGLVTLDADGARHAIISSAGQSVNSGFLGSPNQETIGTPEAPPDVTRFRVTFTAAGTFTYICGLHDQLGMTGRVIVLP